MRETKPRMYRHHPLNRRFGEQQVQKGSVSKIHIHCINAKMTNVWMLVAHMHPTLIKSIGCITFVIELLC